MEEEKQIVEEKQIGEAQADGNQAEKGQTKVKPPQVKHAKSISQADIRDKIKKNKRMIALIIFAVIVLAMILLGILALKVPTVPLCILLLMEVVIAVLLHKAELWIHGMLLLAEVIAGILAGNVMLVIFCAIVYVAATITLQIVYAGEK